VNRSIGLRAGSLFLALAALLATAAPAAAIVNGEPDGTAHGNVGLLAANVPGYGLVAVCSGTLISPTVFLTAAHCTAAIEGAGISEALVTFDQYPSRESAFIPGAIYTSPYFNHRSSDPYDIAVVVLNEPVFDVVPAQLPAAGLLDAMSDAHLLKDQTFTSVGYGAIGWVPQPGGPGFYTDGQRRAATPSFMALNDAWLRLSQNPATADSGTCYGDSGGPNFLGDSNLIVAITITGDHVCRATNVDYRLDTPYARWFLSHFVPVL
jgi:hypothetical protein